jgi:3',5'-nucleoside bisphosphate phosphatase
MTPRAIVRAAREQGLDLIAICDHNSARNVAASLRAGERTGLMVIAGMEITSSEEVHILGLFPSAMHATAVQEEVYSRLVGENDEEAFGYQVVVDEDDLVEDMDRRLLIGATTLSCEKVVRLIHGHDGVAVASHVDRSGFGIFSQLGFIPPDLALDALEISPAATREAVLKRYPQCRLYPLITSSDAHYPEQIGAVRTVLEMAKPTFEELWLALKGLKGRQIVGFERRGESETVGKA